MNSLSVTILLLFPLPADVPETVEYLRDVKPILSARCFACHAAVKQKGGLRVDTAAQMRKGGENGPAIVPGNSAVSLLIKRVAGVKGFSRMPPRKEGDPLEPEQIALLRRWIDQGAKAPDDEQPEIDPREHWAYKKPKQPAAPVVKAMKWVRNPIDAFIAEQHEKRGLTPQPLAAKRTQFRRVHLDLIGLPPTKKEIDAFLNDKSTDAYEKVVDRLLASPQYGERWARHWMDVWRYSDWWGLGQQLRNSQKHIWHWRDWIVESLNKDKGYDRMILEMLAADELYPTDWDALRGTGFLARQYFLFNRNTWLDETVEHTSKAFLGITMNCVKCHAHKYDPIEHEDYYRFRAFFEPYQVRLDQAAGETDFAKNGIPRVFDCNLDAPTFLHVRGSEQQPDKSRKIKPGLPEFFAPKGLTIKSLKLPAEANQPGLRTLVVENYLSKARNRLAAERAKLNNKKHPRAVVEKAIAAAEQSIITVQARANADQAFATKPGEQKTKALIATAALMEKREAVANAELELAKAKHERNSKKDKKAAAKVKAAEAALAKAKQELAKPGMKHRPLRGALKSLESNLESTATQRKPFPKTSTGRRSALAKWIASRDNPLTARVAVNHLWAKHFGQPLVPTVFNFGLKGEPPTHPKLLDWLAVEFMENGWSMKHIHRLIVTSNTYRMTTSSVGAPASNFEKDPDNKYYWRMPSKRMQSQVVRDSLLHLAGELDLTLGGPSIEGNQQAGSRRRSLYFFHSAIKRNQFLTTFDEADPLDCYRRRESIVPQQALALSNSKLALEAAQKITKRVETNLAKSTDREFARYAFLLVLCYEPNEREILACVSAMERWRKIYQKQGNVDHQARFMLVNTLLNHNDFVTIR